MYPALADLTVYAKTGVPLTFGSDAHNPNQVGKDTTRPWNWPAPPGIRNM